MCNEDSAFVRTHVTFKKERKPAAVARFETRWQPPIAFFERMASRYPFLMFLMRVQHEDDESYPNGYFHVAPVEAPPVQAPPPSRQASDDSELAIRTENMEYVRRYTLRSGRACVGGIKKARSTVSEVSPHCAAVYR